MHSRRALLVAVKVWRLRIYGALFKDGLPLVNVMMDKPHVARLKFRPLDDDFVLEAPRRRSSRRTSAIGPALLFLTAAFFAVAVVWVLRHGGFERATDIFRLVTR